MTGRRVAAVALVVGLLIGGPALAQDVWTGPYLGPTRGEGFGIGVYTFNTDGHYNTAAGQVYEQPLYGTPIGGVLGYNWQLGGLLYGVESFFFSHGVSAVNSCMVAWPEPPPGVCGTENPFMPPGTGTIDMKGHWFTGFTGRFGAATGNVMAYVQGGVVIGHLVSELKDNSPASLEHWSYGTAVGVIAGAGFEVMMGPRWSIGLGYRAIWLRPLHFTGPSRDQATDAPAGQGTASDHTLQYRAHEIVARMIFHPGRRGAVDVASRPPFDWPGFSFGWYAGALWQLGLQAGYDWAIGERMIAGVNVQGSFNFCCGRSWEADLNARVGFVFRDNVLLYAEAGIGTQTGDFFDILFGPFYTLGLGAEYAFTNRVTGFVEAKLVHELGGPVADGNFQAGLNFHLGHR